MRPCVPPLPQPAETSRAQTCLPVAAVQTAAGRGAAPAWDWWGDVGKTCAKIRATGVAPLCRPARTEFSGFFMCACRPSSSDSPPLRARKNPQRLGLEPTRPQPGGRNPRASSVFLPDEGQLDQRPHDQGQRRRYEYSTAHLTSDTATFDAFLVPGAAPAVDSLLSNSRARLSSSQSKTSAAGARSADQRPLGSKHGAKASFPLRTQLPDPPATFPIRATGSPSKLVLRLSSRPRPNPNPSPILLYPLGPGSVEVGVDEDECGSLV